MRALIIVAGTVLTLSACGNNDQADNAANVDENLAAENIVANDVTAIDAVTADAANMAADVDYNELENLTDNVANTDSAESRTRPSARPTAPSKPPLEEPTPAEPSNTTE